MPTFCKTETAYLLYDDEGFSSQAKTLPEYVCTSVEDVRKFVHLALDDYMKDMAQDPVEQLTANFWRGTVDAWDGEARVLWLWDVRPTHLVLLP